MTTILLGEVQAALVYDAFFDPIHTEWSADHMDPLFPGILVGRALSVSDIPLAKSMLMDAINEADDRGATGEREALERVYARL